MFALVLSLSVTAILFWIAYRFRNPKKSARVETIRASEPDAGFACKVGLHSFRNVSVNYSYYTRLAPRWMRIIVRSTVDECSGCHKVKTEIIERRVARDWSYPERLFPKVKT